MQRRTFLQSAAATLLTAPLFAAVQKGRWDTAVEILERATHSKQVAAATLHVGQRDEVFARHFGEATTNDAMFLLGSISKPINIAAVMTLFDQGKFQLDDRVKKYLPPFTGQGRDDVTIRHLMTHVSGLSDQLANNGELRKQHATLTRFAEHAQRAPLSFKPGTKYQYSSMGILLATHIAEKLSGTDILTLVDRAVLQPLGMKHSAQGIGKFKLTDLVRCQMEGAAPESGAGDPTSKDWDWNSPYWRKLGAPWGGTHCSAGDVARFIADFMNEIGAAVKPETARLMLTNHNPAGLKARGLGFDLGTESGSKGCSDQTFGHTGSTGTLAWADRKTKTICVILTSLPRRAVQPHPREQAADQIAAAMG